MQLTCHPVIANPQGEAIHASTLDCFTLRDDVRDKLNCTSSLCRKQSNLHAKMERWMATHTIRYSADVFIVGAYFKLSLFLQQFPEKQHAEISLVTGGAVLKKKTGE
jgi:hypothetical protein